jgi:hypothetical protein
LLTFAVFPLAVAGYLIYLGQQNQPKFPDVPPDRLVDPVSPFLFVKLPMILGALIILFLLWSFFANLGKEIIVTPKTLTYKKGGAEWTALWKNLTFTPPRYDKKHFKSCSVSDGKKFGRIEEFYFPEFETLVEVIKAGKSGSSSEYDL